MKGVKSFNTRPELIIRRYLHKEGFRFRLHVRSMPGRPDIVLPRYHAVVEVRGCFWHSHGGVCVNSRIPSTRRSYWRRKLSATRARDAKNTELLRGAGWKVIEVWECEISKRRLTRLRSQLRAQVS
jgi:DNA mismatch endonuclease, patch repair protein